MMTRIASAPTDLHLGLLLSGYYDHHPLATLDRHLVLTGYFSSETRQIGYQLAALTGLGVNDLERTMEHHAGASVRDLMHGRGERYFRELESRCLQDLLEARPLAVITLGDGTLIDETCRQRVLAGSKLVVLDLDLAGCYWRIRKLLLDNEKAWHPLYPGPIDRFEQVRPFFEQRQPGFAKASHRIDLALGRRRAVDRLLEITGGAAS